MNYSLTKASMIYKSKLETFNVRYFTRIKIGIKQAIDFSFLI